MGTSGVVGWSCGRYEGAWNEDDLHGKGTYTDPTGWSYTGALARDQPTKGVLTEADGRRFTVAYAKTCKRIFSNPTPTTKVGGIRGNAVLELQPVHVREAAGVCGLWDAVDMWCLLWTWWRCACVCGGDDARLTLSCDTLQKEIVSVQSQTTWVGQNRARQQV